MSKKLYTCIKQSLFSKILLNTFLGLFFLLFATQAYAHPYYTVISSESTTTIVLQSNTCGLTTITYCLEPTLFKPLVGHQAYWNGSKFVTDDTFLAFQDLGGTPVDCSNPPPPPPCTINITGHPQDQTFCEGNPPTFCVSATGTGLSYQWEYSFDGVNSAGNAGEPGNNTSCMSGFAATALNAYFRARIIDQNGCTEYSSWARLLEHPNITIQPQDQRFCGGNSPTLCVTASGTGLSYQWEYSLDGVNPGGNAGETGNTTACLSDFSTTAIDAYFRVRITNAGGCVGYSDWARVLGNSEINITAQSQNQGFCGESSPTFCVTASGTGLSYQWEYSLDGVNPGGNAGETGNTTACLSDFSTTAIDAYFRVRITNSDGCVIYSDWAKLMYFGDDVDVTISGNDVELCPEEEITLTANASTGVTYYQWTSNPPTPITGSTSANITVSPSVTTTYQVSAIRVNTNNNLVINAGFNNSNFTLINATNTFGQPVSLFDNNDNTAGESFHADRNTAGTTWGVGYDLGQDATITNISFDRRNDCCSDRSDGGVVQIFKDGNMVYQSDVVNGSGDGIVAASPAPNVVGDEVRYVFLNGIDTEYGGATLNFSEWILEGEYTEASNLVTGYGFNSSRFTLINATNSNGAPASLFDEIDNTAGDSFHATRNTAGTTWGVSYDLGQDAVITGVSFDRRNDCCSDRSDGGVVQIFKDGNMVYQSDVVNGSGDGIVAAIPASNVVGDEVRYVFLNGIDTEYGGATLNFSEWIIAGDYQACIGEASATVIVGSSNSLVLTCEYQINDGAWVNDDCSVDICEGDKLIIGMEPSSGNTIVWTGPDGSTYTGADLLISNNTSSFQAGTYSATVTNSDGCSSSTKSIDLTVNSINITTQPSDQLFCTGVSPTFCVAATGTGLSYQWEYSWNGVNAEGNAGEAGNTTACLSSFPTTAIGAYFRTRITDVNGCVVYSDWARIIEWVEPVFSCEYQINDGAWVNDDCSVDICEGDKLIIGIEPSSGNTIVWTGPDGSTYTGADLLISNNTSSFQAGTYSATVTNSDGCSSSTKSIDLTVNSINITTQPSDQLFCTGVSPTFCVVATGTGLSYQWEYSWNGVNAEGNAGEAGNTTACLSSFPTTAIGAYFRTRITDVNGCVVYSDWARIIEWVEPVFSCEYQINDGAWVNDDCSVDICEGDKLIIGMEPSSGNTIVWTGPDGSTYTGADLLISNNTSSFQAGTYSATVTNSDGCSSSKSIELTVHPSSSTYCSCLDKGGDTDGDGVCDNDDCEPNNPNIPAVPGSNCDDGNPSNINDVIQANGCDCTGQVCDIEANVTLAVYNDNGTPAILTDDTFTFQITANGSGTGWVSENKSGLYGEVVFFGPYPTDQEGAIIKISDNLNLNCHVFVGVNMSSCVYTGSCTCCGD